MNIFVQAVGRVNKWVGRLAGLLILAVVLIILREVVARSLFNAPSLWADESMTYLAGFAYVLGGGYTLLYRGHVTVDMVYVHFSERGKRICDLISFFLFSAYCFTLIWYGWDLATTSFGQNETTGTLWSPPVWPVKFAIPIAGVLLYLQGLANLIENFQTKR
jgi:TRAP-type mannitol/chloroaromatic compound transport system permease small subunit